MNARPKLIEFIVVFAACFALSAAFTAPWHPDTKNIPTVYQGKAEYFAQLDVSGMAYMLAWGAHHPGRFYDAPVLFPVRDPLVANDPRLTEGIWSIPLFRLLPVILAWGVTLWLALTFTAIGCYYAGRIFTGSRWGGAALMVLFSFGMFRANQVCNVEGIFAPFLALSFAGMVSFLETPKRWTMACFAIALTLAVIEYSYTAVALGVTLPFAYAYGIWRRKVPWKQAVIPLLIAGALTALILFPVALKYAAFHQSLGIKRHIMQVDSSSADLFAWITGPTGRILPPFGGEFQHNFVVSQLFPGFVLLIAGMAGIVMLWRKSPEIVLMGVLGFFLSFGTMRFLFWQMGLDHIQMRTPYELLYDFLLPFKAIRAPARFGLLTHLFLAFAGTMVIVKMSSSRHGKVLAVILLCISFLEARAGMHAVRVLPERADNPAYQWLARQPGDFAVLEVPAGLNNVRLQQLGEAESMMVALVHGKRTPNGTFAASMPWHDSICVNTANPAHGEAKRVLQALGVGYVVARDASAGREYARAGYRCVYGTNSDVSIFEVESPCPVAEGLEDLASRLKPDIFRAQTGSSEKPESASIRAPAILQVNKGDRFELPVTIRNTGSNTWAGNSYIYGKGGAGDIVAGFRCWRRGKTGVPDFARGPRGEILGATGSLPCNLLPGESAEVIITGIAPVIPGSYAVEVDIAVKGLGWVSPDDSPPVTIQAEVR